jgi:ribosomal protein S18 acetylase RimI-like enzyme
MHINLVPRLQGSGHGSELITTLLAALRAQGSWGVHLLVPRRNRQAVGFYRHIGFTELLASELAALDIHLFGMGLRQAS